MKFHSMTLLCWLNRGTTFSQTVTYNNNVFLPADTKFKVQRHTFCKTLVNKNRQHRTFYNSVGGRITGVKRNFWLARVGNAAEKNPLAVVRGPPPSSENNRPKTPKNAKSNNLLKTKKVRNTNIYIEWGLRFCIYLSGGRFLPLEPR